MKFQFDKLKTAKSPKVLMAGGLAHLIHDGFADMLYVLFPIWQAQLALTFVQVGLLKTLFSGSMSCFQVPSGLLAERLGKRKVLLLGTLVTSLAIISLGWASTFIVLACLLVFGGIGSSVQHPLASSAISSAYDGQKLRAALSTYNFLGDIGKLIIPALAALLIVEIGWPATSSFLGFIGLVTALLIFLALPTDNIEFSLNKKVKALGAQPVMMKCLKNKAFLALSGIGVIDSATRTGFLTFLPFLLQDKGANVTTIGFALSLIFAGGATGKLVCGMIATRLGILRTVIITEVITAICILSVISMNLASALILAPIIGVALNGTSSVLYGSVPELVREDERTHAFSAFYTATTGAGGIAPALYGLAGDAIGVGSSVMIVAALVLITIPLTLPLRGRIGVVD